MRVCVRAMGTCGTKLSTVEEINPTLQLQCSVDGVEIVENVDVVEDLESTDDLQEGNKISKLLSKRLSGKTHSFIYWGRLKSSASRIKNQIQYSKPLTLYKK